MRGGSGQLDIVLVNLLVNAAQAATASASPRVRVSTATEAGHAVISVEDNGPGVAPEVRPRLFEPFFTTKGEDGTGLGLPMVYACAERHNGSISLETAPGKGARFTLWLPGTAAAAS